MAFRVAAVQMNSRDDKAANVATAEELIARAARAGAHFVALPELWTYLGPQEGNLANAEPIPGPVTERLAALARQHHIILHGGSFLEAGRGDDPRPYNTSVVFYTDGTQVARYRKIHLFDAAPLPGAPPYCESATVAAGHDVVTVAREQMHLGLAICYDLRFPELFRALAMRGAEVLAVPSAFTLETGRDHWEVLVRARAIENGCFVVAPGQCGPRPPDRVTFGHSLIVDPWGTILAQAPDGPGVIVADLDLDRVGDVRRRLPALANRRPDLYS